MLSSTSSSDERIPTARYGREWVAVLLTTAILAALLEVHWRTGGHTPNITDGRTFWAMHRDRVYSRDDRKMLVLVGDSRAQLGLDPAVFREAFPEYGVVHLAIDGTSSFEVVTDLCHDNRFDGVILFATNASFTWGKERGGGRDLEYLRYYREQYRDWSSWDERLDNWIGPSLQAKLVQLSSGISLRRILLSRGSPRPLYAVMDADRFRPAHYRTRMTAEELRKRRASRVAFARSFIGNRLPLAEFEQVAGTELGEAGRILRGRGGKIALVQLPTSGEHWSIHSAFAPKDEYWDRITPISGIATIHFKDYPELDDFECPDASHLDATDVPEFTRRLAHILRMTLGLIGTGNEQGQPESGEGTGSEGKRVPRTVPGETAQRSRSIFLVTD